MSYYSVTPQPKLMKNLLLFLLICLLPSQHTLAQLAVHHLLTENRSNPVGIDVKWPRFSWQLGSAKRNVRQTAYELQVSEGKKTVWSSGRVASEQSVQIPYAGQPLQSGRRYSWKVRVWDNQSMTSNWSDEAQFQTALFNPEAEFTAKWIRSGLPSDTANGLVPQFRKAFTAKGKIASAVAYITARGLYEAQINGQRVGDAYLTPGWTSYNKRLLYQTYDVTNLLTVGQNAIGVRVGNGWYRGEMTWKSVLNLYGDQTGLLFQLDVTYLDGTRETIGSDGSWKVGTGPVRFSEIYDGETYDARLEQTGWTKAGYKDANWTPAVEANFPKNNLLASNHELIKKHEVIKPVALVTNAKGETILDFGQNVVGWVKFKAQGKVGDKLVLHHAEVLNEDKTLYLDNLRNASAVDTYYLKGGVNELEPHFTFHGFRYVKIDGLTGKPNLADYEAVALYSDIAPTGTFECSNPLVNQLQKNIQWGQRGNFLDVPTDCPQRDERLGWTGDAEVFSRTAAFNFNVNSFFAKWLGDVAADQAANGSIPFVIPDALAKDQTFGTEKVGAAGWSDAGIIIPWNMYVVYGDRRIVETQYPSMKAYLNYMRSKAQNDLWNTGFQFGDWLSYRVDDSKGMIGQKSAVTDNYLVAQCFYAYSADLMTNAARLLGKTDEAADYENLAKRIRAAFQREYTTASGRLISETQTAYVLALQFDMLPEPARPAAVTRLVDNVKSYDYHLTTGFLGTPFLTHVLTRFGHNDVAYKLLQQETYPSWLYPVKMGATTIWERWDSMRPDGTFQDPGMTSFNHYAYGAVGDWLYRVVAGIDVDERGPGYKQIIIKPQPGGGLTHAAASLNTYYGTIRSGWKQEGGKLTLSVAIPANTTATIYVPAASADAVRENGQSLTTAGLTVSGSEGGYVAIPVGSGTYSFSVN